MRKQYTKYMILVNQTILPVVSSLSYLIHFNHSIEEYPMMAQSQPKSATAIILCRESEKRPSEVRVNAKILRNPYIVNHANIFIPNFSGMQIQQFLSFSQGNFVYFWGSAA